MNDENLLLLIARLNGDFKPNYSLQPELTFDSITITMHDTAALKSLRRSAGFSFELLGKLVSYLLRS